MAREEKKVSLANIRADSEQLTACWYAANAYTRYRFEASMFEGSRTRNGPTIACLTRLLPTCPAGVRFRKRGKAARLRWCSQCHWRRNDFPAVYAAAQNSTPYCRSAHAVSLRRRRAKTAVSSRSPPPAARFINDRRLSWRDGCARAAALLSALSVPLATPLLLGTVDRRPVPPVAPSCP